MLLFGIIFTAANHFCGGGGAGRGGRGDDRPMLLLFGIIFMAGRQTYVVAGRQTYVVAGRQTYVGIITADLPGRFVPAVIFLDSFSSGESGRRINLEQGRVCVREPSTLNMICVWKSCSAWRVLDVLAQIMGITSGRRRECEWTREIKVENASGVDKSVVVLKWRTREGGLMRSCCSFIARIFH